MNDEELVVPIGGGLTPVDVPTDTPCVPEGDEIIQTIEPEALDIIDNDEVIKPSYSVGQYFGTLQSSVTTVWTYHLKTNKHFVHVELDKLYHTLLEKVDNLIEVYQGIIGGNVDGEFVNVIYSTDKDESGYLMELRNYIITGRMELFPEEWTEVWSIIDDILNIMDSTIYKLTSFSEPAIKTFESFCYEKYKNDEVDE